MKSVKDYTDPKYLAKIMNQLTAPQAFLMGRLAGTSLDEAKQQTKKAFGLTNMEMGRIVTAMCSQDLINLQQVGDDDELKLHPII